jgi:2-keto-4-pentenoate hydratase/2-oxohepta-3-ene-1,7-dioic acid hydratase in catechol pathway
VRLVTYADQSGATSVGALREDSSVIDTGYVDLGTFISAGDAALEQARSALASGAPIDNPKLLAPHPKPGKMLFLGRSFREFRNGLDDDVEPFVYARTQSTIIGPGERILMPEPDATVLYEAELLIILGRTVKRVSEAEAMSCVFGYTQVNDLTWTDWLHVPEGMAPQLCLCKNADTFCPMGPYVVTSDEFDPTDVDFGVSINGEEVMRSSTKGLVWSVARILEFFSRAMTLEAGDVIATGTPAAGPIKVGDDVVVEFAGLGELRNPVVAGW